MSYISLNSMKKSVFFIIVPSTQLFVKINYMLCINYYMISLFGHCHVYETFKFKENRLMPFLSLFSFFLKKQKYAYEIAMSSVCVARQQPVKVYRGNEYTPTIDELLDASFSLRVVSKEIRRLVLPRTSYLLFSSASPPYTG
jgi:hypothetical protein